MSSILKIIKMKFPITPLLLYSITPILLLCGNSFPQNIEGVNARLDAMGGSAAADDIGWTIGHPASIYKFPNHFQGNVCLMPIPGIDRKYGAAIGIVRFNEFLHIGVTLNNRLMMGWYRVGGQFYYEGVNFLNAPHFEGDPFPNIPNVNVCFKLRENIQIGVGGYFEALVYDYKATKIHTYSTTTGIDTIFYEENHDKKKIKNIGFNIESRITLNSITIYPQLIIGFPKIEGSESYDELDGALQYFNNSASIDTFTNLRYTYSSPQGLFLKGGSYLWANIGKTFWKTGVTYNYRSYQFNKKTDILTQELNTNGTVLSTVLDTVYDSLPSDHKFHLFDLFIALVPSFSDNLYFSPEWDGGIWMNKLKDPNNPPDTTFYFMYHNLRLGIEKVKDGFWFFDEIAFRCGIQGHWGKMWRYIENFDNVITSDYSTPWYSFFFSDFTRKQAKVTGGFGLKKGRGSFDLSCDWLRWHYQSVLTGPSAAMATLTVDFSRKKDF